MEQQNLNNKQRGAEKLARIPVKIERTVNPLEKPKWIRISASTSEAVSRLKNTLRENKLVTVCEEASCPNLSECFSHGIATFMIMGDKCTRRCSFCDVAHGRPDPLDPTAPVTEIVPVPGFNVKCLPEPEILLPNVRLLLASVVKVKVLLLFKVTAPSYRW